MPPRSEISGQNWTQVTFNKPTLPAPAKPRPEITREQKLDRETEELSHASVPKDVRLAIAKARLSKNLTQKALAAQLSLPPTTITEYESGKAIPNNALIARLEKHLGAKLPRAR